MPAPVSNTCPAIDTVIKTVKDVIEVANSIGVYASRTHDPDDLQKFIYDLIYAVDTLANVEDVLEELRTANELLREWGYETEAELDRIYER